MIRFRHALPGCVVLALMPSLAEAEPLAIVRVEAPAIHCIFNPVCHDTSRGDAGLIMLPGANRPGYLRWRTFRGMGHVPATGKYGYDYRVDLTDIQPNPAGACVSALKIDFPRLLTYDYKPGTPGQVYVIGAGDKGSIAPTSADMEGSAITFTFATPVCPGQSSYFFGLASWKPPVESSATLTSTQGKTTQVENSSPAH
jgi:hypothetical protein